MHKNLQIQSIDKKMLYYTTKYGHTVLTNKIRSNVIQTLDQQKNGVNTMSLFVKQICVLYVRFT